MFVNWSPVAFCPWTCRALTLHGHCTAWLRGWQLPPVDIASASSGPGRMNRSLRPAWLCCWARPVHKHVPRGNSPCGRSSPGSASPEASFLESDPGNPVTGRCLPSSLPWETREVFHHVSDKTPCRQPTHNPLTLRRPFALLFGLGRRCLT